MQSPFPGIPNYSSSQLVSFPTMSRRLFHRPIPHLNDAVDAYEQQCDPSKPPRKSKNRRDSPPNRRECKIPASVLSRLNLDAYYIQGEVVVYATGWRKTYGIGLPLNDGSKRVLPVRSRHVEEYQPFSRSMVAPFLPLTPQQIGRLGVSTVLIR
jgi:hypothetical protein